MNLPLPLTDAKRSVAAISVVSEISEILVQADSTAELLSRVLDSFSARFGIEHGYMLVPVREDQLCVAAGLGVAREQIDSAIRTIRCCHNLGAPVRLGDRHKRTVGTELRRIHG